MVFYVLSAFGIDSITFLHWLLALSIGCLLLDIFFQTELFSYVGVFLFASYFTGCCELFLPIQWSIVLFVLFFLIGLSLYFVLWRRIIHPFVLGFFLNGAAKEPIETAKNQKGIFRNINGVCFVDWNGELWNARGESLKDYQEVEILRIESGILYYKKIQKKD